MDGKTQEAAAAAAGMCERSARNWQEGPLPSESRGERVWRTRKDPFEEVWASQVEPLLVVDTERVLEATTILEVLNKTRAEAPAFGAGQIRTLQRRMRSWRALQGPAREVYFEQVHPPGREGALDFTNCNDLGVTIAGEAFPHLLFEFVLSCSTWTWIDLAFGETFEALVAGFQGALWDLGGCPKVVRTDNLSAATHELKEAGRGLTQRFADVLAHYDDMKSTRIQPGKSNENGGVEQRHRRTKSALRQALVLRGSAEFESQAAYLAFARAVVAETHNAKIAERLAEERPHLVPLPATKVPEYTTWTPTVRCWSTIRVNNRTYSVPSRLIGHEVEVRQYANHVEVRFEQKLVETMPRLRGERTARIDYRHIIWSLVRKPGAFARYRFREELFPSLAFRQTYDALVKTHGDRADVEYLRILHLAASTLECSVEAALVAVLAAGARFDYASVKAKVKPETPSIPDMPPLCPDLASYDKLLVGGAA